MKISRLSCTMFLAALLHSVGALAAPPATVTYQGTLSTAAGSPVTQTLNIQFKLYDVQMGGDPLWSESQSISVINGKFAVQLGANTPLVNELFGEPLFLGIQVDGDVEMTPRPSLSATPYAFRARSLLRNTIHVALDGTPAQSAAALSAALQAAGLAASVSNPMTVELDAGRFELPASITIPAFVTLAGQGREATVLAGAVNAALVFMGSNTSLRQLSVINEGAGGDFDNPTAAINIVPSSRGVRIRDVKARSQPPAGGSGPNVWVVLNMKRVSDLVIEQSEFHSEGGANMVGIRAVSVVGEAPVEDQIFLRDVVIRINGGSALVRGFDSSGRYSFDLQSVRIEVVGGTAGPANTLGLRTQSEVDIRVRDLDVNLRYADGQPVELRGLAFNRSARVDIERFSVNVDAGSCETNMGFRDGIVFFNTEDQPGLLTQQQPRVKNGTVSVASTDCFVGGIYNAGSKPILDQVTVNALQRGNVGGASAFLLRSSDDGCDSAPSQTGRSEIRNSSLVAHGPPEVFPSAVDTCVDGLHITNSTLQGLTYALRVSDNISGSFSYSVSNSELSSAFETLGIFGESEGHLLHVTLRLTSNGTPVFSVPDPQSGERGTATCIATAINNAFVAGPLCPCTSGLDCPATP